MNRFAGWGILLFTVLSSLFSVSVGTGAVPASIVTTTGMVSEGSILGLAPRIRLIEPGSVGPASELEVSIASIKQITIDFPRIVIETGEKTLIGPFSAFSGIDEALILEQEGGGDLSIPTASIRAIALNGNPLQPAARVWLGDRFLKMPKVVPVGSIGGEAGCPACTISEPDRFYETPSWDTNPPVLPPAEESLKFPWWLGLIGVAALLTLVYFVVVGTGST